MHTAEPSLGLNLRIMKICRTTDCPHEYVECALLLQNTINTISYGGVGICGKLAFGFEAKFEIARNALSKVPSPNGGLNRGSLTRKRSLFNHLFVPAK